MPVVGTVMDYLGPMGDGKPSPVKAALVGGSYKIALQFKKIADFDNRTNFRLGYRPVNYNRIPSTWFIGYDRLKTWNEDGTIFNLTLIAFDRMSISGGVEVGFNYFDADLPAPMPLIPSWDDYKTGDLVTQKFTFPVVF
jgi:hypothetical protein